MSAVPFAQILRDVVDPALQALPVRMTSAEARVMLLAIGAQESRLIHRKQLPLRAGMPPGPARGLWQFEAGGGVVGIINHPASRRLALEALQREDVPPTPRAAWAALAENDLAEILADVFRFQQDELADRGIKVEAETQDRLPTVMADRDQVKQAFFNVIKNAMEAMKPGGVLRVGAAADDDFVTVVFGDTGSGIRQEDLLKLFEPYHTTKAEGHGLGLMIVQRILREHGGQVGIESKEGVGTVVTLRFPRKDRRVRMLAPAGE
jgi:anti-sigma regulatory factor (Ser/Thr protein kinase)